MIRGLWLWLLVLAGCNWILPYDEGAQSKDLPPVAIDADWKGEGIGIARVDGWLQDGSADAGLPLDQGAPDLAADSILSADGIFSPDAPVADLPTTPDTWVAPDQPAPDVWAPPDQAVPDQLQPDAGIPGTFLWSKAFGGSNPDVSNGVAVDSSGNVYIAGYYESATLSLGGSPLVNQGKADMFVASYTAAGVHRWSKSFGGGENDVCYAVTADSAGNIYLTGYFDSATLNLGGGPLASSGLADLFVASFTSAGAHRWSKRFGAAIDDVARSVAVDGSGNVYLTGSYDSGATNLGGSTLPNAGGRDLFVASYDPTGAHRWSKGFGGTVDDNSRSVAVDGSGNVYVTGYFASGTLNVGGANLNNAGKEDIFVASYTSTGAHRWSNGFGSNQADEGYAVAVDSAGNAFVTGYFAATVDFGGGGIKSAGSVDAFLVRFTSGGAHVWSKPLGAKSDEIGMGVDTDGTNVYLVGQFWGGPVDLGGGGLTSAGAWDGFVASFTAAGGHRWSTSFGGTQWDHADRIAKAGSTVYVTGIFESNQLDFGGGPYTNAGFYDLYLLRYIP